MNQVKSHVCQVTVKNNSHIGYPVGTSLKTLNIKFYIISMSTKVTLEQSIEIMNFSLYYIISFVT